MFRKYMIWAIVLMLSLILACTGLGTARAASVDSFTFDCLAVHVKGHTTVSARTVRITVTLASDLRQQIGDATLPINPTVGAPFSLDLPYPSQTPGTRLVVAVGEWDGQKYLVPAQLMGFDVPPCAATPTPTSDLTSAPLATASADWATFADSRLGFSFSYPINWVRQEGAGENAVTFAAPPDYRTGITVTVYFNGAEPMSEQCAYDLCPDDQSRIDEIFSLRLGRMVVVPTNPNIVFVRGEDVTIDGERGATIDRWVAVAEHNKTRLVFVRTAGRVYAIQGNYQTDDELATWLKVIDSFHWLKS